MDVEAQHRASPPTPWRNDRRLRAAISLLGATLQELAGHQLVEGLPAPQVRCFEDAIHLDYPSAGLSIICERTGVAALQFHANGHNGFVGWWQRLPAGLRFDMDREQVRAHLSPPSAAGEARHVPGLGDKPAWDLFLAGSGELHVEYRPGGAGGVQLLSVQSPLSA